MFAEDSLCITSNVPGDATEENQTIQYTCDVRYAGSLTPSLKWTTLSSPKRTIPATEQNSPGIARSVIEISGNRTNNGERFVCTMYFNIPVVNEYHMTTNAPACTLQIGSIPLTVYCKYIVSKMKA